MFSRNRDYDSKFELNYSGRMKPFRVDIDEIKLSSSDYKYSSGDGRVVFGSCSPKLRRIFIGNILRDIWTLITSPVA